MGVVESITTEWDATMGGWHDSTVIRGHHCVGGGLYEGHVEMYLGTRHPLAQNYCLKNWGPILGTAPPPIGGLFFTDIVSKYVTTLPYREPQPKNNHNTQQPT